MSIAPYQHNPSDGTPASFGAASQRTARGSLLRRPNHGDPKLLAGKSWFTKQSVSLVGIDIDIDEVRIAIMKPSTDGNKSLAWRSLHRFDLPKPQGEKPTPRWTEAVMETLPQGLPKCVDGEQNFAAVALPIAWTHYQTITGSELAETRLRYNEMFAGSVFRCNAHVSHWPVVGVHHGRPSDEDQYVVAAAPHSATCEISERISEAGFEVRSILPNGVALAHAARKLTGVNAQSVLWLSKSSALVSVIHQSGIGLSRTLNAVPERILELDKPERALDCCALKPYLSEIADELKSTIQFAARADMARPSDLPILLCGPLAELEGVDETLATLTRKPIALWRYIGKSRPTPLARELGSDFHRISHRDARFSTALSLALAVSRTGSRGYAE